MSVWCNPRKENEPSLLNRRLGFKRAETFPEVSLIANYHLNIINEGLAKRVYHGITKIMSLCD